LLLSIFTSVTAQNKNKVEEINITSSFKPSIVKSGKLEFFPEIPLKDTQSYRFKYTFENVVFKTPLSPFSLKPLAYQLPEEPIELNNAYIKVGGGNLRTPFVSAAYQTNWDNNQLSFGVDHISSKGRIPNQQYANSVFSGRFTRQLADNQFFNLNLSYQGDAYRNYGYDTAKFTFNEDELIQRYNLFSFGAGYNLIAGSNANLSLKPVLKLDYLTTKRGAKEIAIAFDLPINYIVDENIQVSGGLNIDYTQLNNEQAVRSNATLVQLPLKVAYLTDGLFASGGIVSVLKNNKIFFVPDAKLVYTFKEGSAVRLLAGISNAFNTNSLRKLYEINPFLLSPTQLNIFQQTNYYAGFDWLSAKGLQLQTKIGLEKFKNLPLFINGGAAFSIPSGKDFLLQNEAKATAFFIESTLGYIFSDKLSFNSSLKALSFQSQQTFVDPYGIIPIDLSLGFKWSPLVPLNIKFNGQVLGGNMAIDTNGQPIKTRGILDLGLAVDYNLNKKWALWIDLNNIANAKYQRWNGYTSFGFNFLLGIRFNFTQLAQ
jgi:hypothetical protein